ncbi:Oidioi.mRNA.OKI2018_I69.chr1.g738.t1.cds [Oikopleura dioica]|uniref:Oidioi.mRNA.OKI2018_I69.chr1.g738.t1.cds n=1 Tax=Oikopleura dioica TaxID=34765 RepID=A0ABN7SLA7_OIKDI|nr:Oidioi.mRNA.OKI2018_I69.chr1.g738.t1.cds [Oikopleura dioica]
MKAFNLIASIALARDIPSSDSSASSLDEVRIWTPDTTARETILLTGPGDIQTYTLPTDPTSGDYYPDQYIRINVEAPEGFKIVQTFNSFKLDGVGFTNECDQDAVIIYDGPDGNAEAARLCGIDGQDNFSFLSTNNVMTLVFKSNEDIIVQPGFEAQFEAVELEENEIAWIRIMDAFNTLTSTIFVEHDHKKDHIQTRKTELFKRKFSFNFAWFEEMAADSCTNWAAAGDSAEFVPIVIDSVNHCVSINNFMTSLRSFYERFVCFDTYADLKFEEQRFRRPKLTNRKLDNLTYRLVEKKFHLMGCDQPL